MMIIKKKISFASQVFCHLIRSQRQQPTSTALISLRQLSVGVLLMLCLAPVQVVNAQQIVFEGKGEATGAAGTTTLTINSSANTAVGHLLFAVLSTRDDNVFTAPSGWQQLFEVATNSSGRGSGNVDLTVFWKVATVSDAGGASFNFGINADKEVAGAVLSYSGVDSNAPIDIFATATGDSNKPTAPSVVTTEPNAMVVRMYSQYNNDNITTFPPDERVDLTEDQVTIGVSDLAQPGAGNTGIAEFSGNDNREWASATVALRPSGPEVTINKATTTVGPISPSDTVDYTIVVTNVEAVPVPPQELSQWATGVVGFSSQWDQDGTDYQAIQALGEPDVPSCGDQPNAWAPLTTGDITEYLELSYNTPVFATGVRIRETFQPGFVKRVDLCLGSDGCGAFPDLTNWVTVYDANVDPADNTACLDFFSPTFAQTGLVDRIRITTQQSGFEEIDAVELTGFPEITPPTSIVAEGVSVSDTLPVGFSYVSGTVAFDNVCADTTVDTEPVAGANALSWGTWDMEENCEITISFTVSVDGDSALGTVSNAASAIGENFSAVFDPGTDTDEDVNVVCALDEFSILNSATVISNETDADLSDNTASACTVIIKFTDHGDAPATYGDAAHVIGSSLHIGAIAPDSEPDSQNTPNADGDSANIDDENGVVFSAIVNGEFVSVTATVPVFNNTGSDAPRICAWLDRWDENGDSDGAFSTLGDKSDNVNRCQPVAANGGTLTDYTFIWNGLPLAAGTTFARFRVCSTASQCNAPAPDLAKAASDGEVEDYALPFDFTPTGVTIGNVTLRSLPVTDFLQQLSVAQMNNDQLLAMLAIWDPLTAASLELADDAAKLIAALQDFLDSDGDGRVAVLHWDTLEERGTVGFYVERADGESGWVLINNHMLPAMVFAPLGAEYKLVDPGAEGGGTYQYRLIEQEASGNTNEYGPFEVELK